MPTPALVQRESATGPKERQRRSFGVQMERGKSEGGSDVATLDGYASVTEEPYEMWDFLGAYTEVMSTGAFTKTLSESPDVVFLANHEGLPMARTKAGTLELAEDSTGLHMRATVPLAMPSARDLVEAVEAGALTEMSFAFRIMRRQWSPDYSELRINEVNINRGDVAGVTYGANPATSIALRGADLMGIVEHLEGDALVEAHRRLSARLGQPATPPAAAGLGLGLALAELQLD